MRKHWSLVAVALMLACASAAFAYPNLNALTGIVAVPNAYVQPPCVLTGAADVLFLDTTTLNVRALYGISSRFEAGALVVFGNDTGVGVSAKYSFGVLPGEIAWAVGGSVVGASNDTNGTQFFVVATKSFPANNVIGCQIIGTLGVNFANVDDSSTLPFVGVQVAAGPRTEIGAEFEFGSSGAFNNPIASLVVRHQMSSRLVGEVGFTNANGFTGEDDYGPFIGAGYNF